VPVIPSAPGVLFARQAERLETLVVDHPMSDGRRFSQ
jgi:formate dehydrogenase maturation protein FdhE